MHFTLLGPGLRTLRCHVCQLGSCLVSCCHHHTALPQIMWPYTVHMPRHALLARCTGCCPFKLHQDFCISVSELRRVHLPHDLYLPHLVPATTNSIL